MLDVVSDFLKGQIEVAPDITKLELATVLFERDTIRATPTLLSRHLIHRLVIPLFLAGCGCKTYAAIFSFMAGVMPPIPIFGRSLL